MTNEKAIHILMHLADHVEEIDGCIGIDGALMDATLLAIKALRNEQIRCKDCKHYKKVLGAVGGWCDCEFTPFDMDPDDYCSHAEKINEI